MIFLLACAEPQQTAPITTGERTTCSDPTAREELGPMEERPLNPPEWADEYAYGEGFAVADLDGDDRLDVVFADRSSLPIYVATDDGFSEQSASRIPDLVDPDLGGVGAATVAAIDVDGDTDLDLYLGRYPLADVVLLNDGTGHFVDDSEGRGLRASLSRVRGTSFGDVDADGDLDLYISTDHQEQLPPTPGDLDEFYENVGNGVFSNVSDRLPVDVLDGYGRLAAFVDLDDDGALDLYVVNHMPIYRTNRLLYGNGDGTFIPAPEAGADIFTSGMGLGIGDLGNDGLPDLLVSGWNQLDVLESTGERSFVSTAKARGLLPDEEQARVVAWGNEFADFNNDGLLDAVVVFGQAEEEIETGESNPPDEPDGLWVQSTDGTFSQVADEWGVADQGNGRAVAAVDFNGDGWLDLVTQGHKEPPRMWRARCGSATWLEVLLEGSAPNTGAVGARVTVSAGDHTFRRWTTAMGTGLQTSLPPEVHFGLGEIEHVDRLEVRWPDGQIHEWSNLDTNQRIVVRQDSP